MIRRFVMTIGVAMAAAGPMAAQQHQHGKQHGKGEGMGQGMGMMESPWREMNGFHSLLHLSHQAVMKSNDLAPARRNAGLLADAAEAWAKSTAPAECHAPADIGDQVASFAAQARSYAGLVAANGSDDEVKAALDQVHDGFQKLHMACMPMGMGKGKGMQHRQPPR